MGSMDISHLANVLRPVIRDISSGKGKLCLSTNYLSKLCNIIETCTSPDVKSLEIVLLDHTKNDRDLQFLIELVENTINLRIIPDVENNLHDCLSIGRFKNIKVLEIYKLNINTVIGIQKLRSQVQELSCCKSLKSMGDIIQKCGGDNSQAFNWNELRIAKFSQNGIVELDNSFEYTLSLHTLDLSYNNLSKLNILNQLPNLKQLNLAYNKLVAVPNFKGQICNRLQVLILNNNFIEDLVGLTTLSNILQLDIGHNCLLDYDSCLPISHLASLQWLNILGNPLSFHPHHRNLVSSYLNKNTSTIKFSLNGVLLDKGEKNLTGSFHPMNLRMHISSSNNSLDSSTGSLQEKPRRIRNVIIEDENDIKEVKPVSVPIISTQHLEIKRQLEQLREEHGESWLYRQSGLMVQDLLGFKKKTAILSSTSYETAIDTLYLPDLYDDMNTKKQDKPEVSEAEVLITGQENVPEEDHSDISDGEDVYFGGEECLFLAINKSNNMEVFVVVRDAFISERDCTTSKEKSRWHINTIMSCEKCEDNNVQLNFDTLRRDRKQRVYKLEEAEFDVFFNTLRDRMSTYPHKKDEVSFQCMKCFEDFQLERSQLRKQINCPKCQSSLVIENNV